MKEADIQQHIADDEKSLKEAVFEAKINQEDRQSVTSFEESAIQDVIRKRIEPDVKDLKLRYTRRKLKSEE